MLQDFLNNSGLTSDSHRLKLALDIILDFLMQYEGDNYTEDESSLDDGLSSASKSDRLMRLPPPDLSS